MFLLMIAEPQCMVDGFILRVDRGSHEEILQSILIVLHLVVEQPAVDVDFEVEIIP